MEIISITLLVVGLVSIIGLLAYLVKKISSQTPPSNDYPNVPLIAE
jgi:hypothetical protein